MILLEKKIIKLVEERGYMGTKYISVIKEIIDYVQTYIDNNVKNVVNGWQVHIPDFLTKKIDCVDTLMIIVNVIDSNDAYRYSGSGSNAVFLNNNIINGKLGVGKITINGYSLGRYLYDRTIFNSLSHELNHLLAYYKKLLKNQKSQTLFQRAVTENDIFNKTFSNDKDINSYIRDIFYRLLFKSELNALINSVYGDLYGMNSKRNHFNLDIKSVQAYVVYNSIKENLDLLDVLSDDEWNNIIMCFNLNSSYKTKNRVDINSFKKAFKNIVIEKLNELMKGIGKVASFYYDSQDDVKPKNNEITHVDKNTILKKK